MPNAGSTFDNKQYIEATESVKKCILPVAEYYSSKISLVRRCISEIGGHAILRQTGTDITAWSFLSIETITWPDVRIIGGVIENLDIYQLTETTAIYSSSTQNCNADNVRTFGGYNGIFFMALATGTQGGNFDGFSNNVCRLETRFIGPVEEKEK